MGLRSQCGRLVPHTTFPVLHLLVTHVCDLGARVWKRDKSPSCTQDLTHYIHSGNIYEQSICITLLWAKYQHLPILQVKKLRRREVLWLIQAQGKQMKIKLTLAWHSMAFTWQPCLLLYHLLFLLPQTPRTPHSSHTSLFLLSRVVLLPTLVHSYLQWPLSYFPLLRVQA